MGLFRDRQPVVHGDSEWPLFILVIEYVYNIVIGDTCDMGLIHRVDLSYII